MCRPHASPAKVQHGSQDWHPACPCRAPLLLDILLDRGSGTLRKNFMMFTRMCGIEAANNIVLVTTKWDAFPSTTSKSRESWSFFGSAFLKPTPVKLCAVN